MNAKFESKTAAYFEVCLMMECISSAVLHYLFEGIVIILVLAAKRVH